jgi:hypothetical protein
MENVKGNLVGTTASGLDALAYGGCSMPCPWWVCGTFAISERKSKVVITPDIWI